MTFETVKGFTDFSSEEAKKREKIKKILIETFSLYGFEPAETPTIEYEEFVKGNNSQDEVISDIFKLEDKGKRKLALRYEFTFQLKRLSCNKKLPYKRYEIGSVFRDEPVSSNRVREITQCDIDIIGANLKDEAEILSIVSKIFAKLGIKIEINFNNRRLLNEILDNEKIVKKEQVIKEIDKLDKLSEKEVRENLKKLNAEKILNIFKQSESYFKKYPAYKEIEELKKYCSIYNTKVNFQPSLARGLSYYNGNIFEVKTKEMKETISAGGSYLINGIQSTGVSFGLDRISKLAKIQEDNNEVLVISINQDKSSILVAEKLRNEGIVTELWLGKGISKALDYANSKKIKYVIFIGDQEVKNKKFKLKDMKSGKEKLVNESSLIKELKD